MVGVDVEVCATVTLPDAVTWIEAEFCGIVRLRVGIDTDKCWMVRLSVGTDTEVWRLVTPPDVVTCVDTDACEGVALSAGIETEDACGIAALPCALTDVRTEVCERVTLPSVAADIEIDVCERVALSVCAETEVYAILAPAAAVIDAAIIGPVVEVACVDCAEVVFEVLAAFEVEDFEVAVAGHEVTAPSPLP